MKPVHVLLYAACLVVSCARASAQDNANLSETERLEAARQLHRAAVDDFAKGAYLQAVDGFIAADRLTPRPGFLFNIAKSYDASHDVSHALAAYRGYLHQPASPPDADQVADRVKTLSAQLAREGVGQVSVLSQPLGAQVLVDDEPVGTTPIALDLAFGDHVIALTLAGYRELRSKLSVSNSQPFDLKFSLIAIDATKPTPLGAPSAPRGLAQSTRGPTTADYVRPDSTLQIGGFVSLGAGVVALGAGLAFELMRARSERDARDESVQTRYAQDLETIHAQQTLARVFVGSGAVLAAVGGALLGLAYTTSERKPAGTQLSLACAPSNCQGVVSGAF